MVNNIPKISVLVICYKQEDVIRRALDSLIAQKDYIYEICINDDKSPDGTWEIILEYQAKYPDLVKPVQNNPNLGIFQNIEATWKRPTGDMVYQLSGDDVCPDGYFKAVFDFIEKQNIDWKNELFCVYGDFKEIEPDGKEIVYSNKRAPRYNAVKLKIRKLLSARGTCYSKKIVEKFEKVSDGKSFSAEAVQDIQLALFSEKNYYIPVVGNIYYAGIGISTRMSKTEQFENIFEGYMRMIDFVKSHGYVIDKKDIAYIEYIKAYRTHNMKKALKYFLKSLDWSLGLEGTGLARIIFVLKKKIKNI